MANFISSMAGFLFGRGSPQDEINQPYRQQQRRGLYPVIDAPSTDDPAHQGEAPPTYDEALAAGKGEKVDAAMETEGTAPVVATPTTTTTTASTSASERRQRRQEHRAERHEHRDERRERKEQRRLHPKYGASYNPRHRNRRGFRAPGGIAGWVLDMDLPAHRRGAFPNGQSTSGTQTNEGEEEPMDDDEIMNNNKLLEPPYEHPKEQEGAEELPTKEGLDKMCLD